jgi:aspartate/methionine/tyrosine aminotransferase
VLPRLSYLEFAVRWYGSVRFDLATSGLSPISAAELGQAPVDDYGAREPFKRRVAARYGVAPRTVIPCLGTSGALYVAFASLLEPGARVLVESPSYEPLWRIPEALGAAVDRFSTLDIDAVVSALTPETRVVAITNPNNPTGSVMEDAALTELAAALNERGVWLLVDEAYLELARPAHTARHLGQRVLACASTTKCWGVPWARAGFLLVPPELEEAAGRVEQLVFGSAPPACWAYGALAFERATELGERAKALQAGKRAVIDAFMKQHEETLSWVPPPETSLYGWVRDSRGGSLRERIERGIAERGVIVAPGEFFGDPSAFRLSWSTHPEALREGLKQLEAVLKL